MSTLKISGCMSVVKDMSDLDRDALLARLDQYRADGVPVERAQIMAAADTLAELEDERREFMRLLKEQHPDIFTATEQQPQLSADRAQTETPEFKKWFGDSKVVDENGKPLIVYRGQRRVAKPDKFVMTRSRENPSFAADPAVASVYSRQLETREYGAGSNVMPVYLSIQQPLDIRDLGEQVSLESVVQRLPWDWSFSSGLGEDKKRLGYGDLADALRSMDFLAERTGARFNIDASDEEGFRIDSFEDLANYIQERGDEGDVESIDLALMDTTFDAYMIGDSSDWTYLLSDLGFDGVFHKDVFDAGASYYEGDKSKLEEGYEGGPVHDTFRPFEQTQIKSAIGNNGDFAADNPDITKSADRTPLGFYSALARSLEEAPIKSAPAGAWKTAIKGLLNKGAVKADEVEWTGINDWLDLQQGKVSKEQVAQYLEQGGVRVEETVLGVSGMAPQYQEEMRELQDLRRRAEEGEEGVIDDDELDRLRQLEQSADNQEPTKYGQYTLPGGENYREVLLTLPIKAEPNDPEPLKIERRDDGAYVLSDKYGPVKTVPTIEEAEAYRDRRSADDKAVLMRRRENEGKLYRSSHWNQPNVLAHIRVNDRTDADGKRVLFVEELQSDWGQAGAQARKKEVKRLIAQGMSKEDANKAVPQDFGFASDSDVKPVSKKEYDAYVDKLLDDYIEKAVQAGEDRQAAGRRGINMPFPQMAQELGRSDEYARMRAGRDLDMSGGSDKIPAAPFVTKTEGWLNLALKRVMVMAAEGGYDKVAFVNGEQSANRYDLSKQISKIRYLTGSSTGRDLLVATDKAGKSVLNKPISEPKEIEEYVGKEVANRLLNAKSNGEVYHNERIYNEQSLSGLDLKVGGEGMKTFYDTIVPTALKKLLPKVGGGQVGEVQVRTSTDTAGYDASNVWIMDERDSGLTAYRTRAEAERMLPSIQSMYPQKQLRIVESAPDTTMLTQPGFDVTDAMREQVMGGVPLFSRDRASDEEVAGLDDRGIRFSADRDYEPENTVKAYKLFRTSPREPGKLFPLFVNADKPVPMDEWLRAEEGPAAAGGKVKSKLGPLAYRPGWHAGDLPVATHIGMKAKPSDKKPTLRNPEHVWAEVMFAADVDWQEEANKRGTNAQGKLVPVKAHITDQVPEGGFYRYKTNPNMTGNWLIGGEMKVTRVLSDAEVKRINDRAGVADLPREKPLNLKALGFAVRKSEDRQIDTPEFKRWFGDSKVVDGRGRPLVVYHGTGADFTEFKKKDTGIYGAGYYFTSSPEAASGYAQGSQPNVMPVYLSAKNLASAEDYDRIASSLRSANAKTNALIRAGFDGLAIDFNQDRVDYLVFSPEQIKSAIGNSGAFDPANPDITKSADRPWFDDLSELKISTNYQLGDLLKTSKKLNWWDRSVGTQYNIAQKHPQFKRVFDAVQRFINDVSAYATRAADLAPTILPKLETIKDIAKSPLSAEDVKALREPIFGGTLKYTRDDEGNIIETDDVSTAGVVFTNDELRDLFGLNDRQVGLYREFRRATNKSLTDLAVSDMLRYLGTDGAGVRQRALEATNLDGALNAMVAHLDQLIEQNPQRAKVLEDSKRAIKEKAGQAIGLMARGYAPLSRFGQFTVYAVGQDGEQLYFSMFENERDANKMAREMREQYPEATVTTGTMSQESYKLFSGVTPETLALFGESLGLEESGVDAKSEVFQAYLKMAKTNRSAMKRLIQRKGIDGFSEDAGRVLAGFVYSNARQISTNLHAGEISRSASEVTDGDVKDAAIRLMEYIQNPQEEAQAIRGLLFTQFIGGSIASALVNMTQPFTMTLPYLAQFDGATGASKRMADAVKLVSRGIRNDDDLQAALKRGEELGIVSPQEVHQLMAQAQGRGSLQSGDGTKMGDAAAKVNNSMAKLGLVWGKLFSAAEQFNRRVTFIAAYKLARDQGMNDPMAFAEKAIAETQGVYNKGNKPKWARGAVGGTLFTFKQYSIAYVEFLRRMWGNGPEGKKAVGLALGVLFLTAGMSGLPGADDLDDVIDGFMQRVLGRSFDSKQAKKEFFASLLGQAGAEFVMSGLSGLPGVPIDISGRMGLGNLIPGTGIFTKKREYGRDYLEVLGPAGTLFSNMGTAVANVVQGEFQKAAEVAAPVAAQNALKAVDMAQMGYYRDMKGRKVVDTDGWDALAKSIGFQPRAVAQVQGATMTQTNLVGQNKLRETEIADKWARGRIERKPDLVQEAKEELADWNRKNPESKIRIDESQINKRVQEANKTKAQRIAATAPKEIRNAVKKQLESEGAQ
jgi:hypothetical protein